jgi:hypothetical protein
MLKVGLSKAHFSALESQNYNIFILSHDTRVTALKNNFLNQISLENPPGRRTGPVSARYYPGMFREAEPRSIIQAMGSAVTKQREIKKKFEITSSTIPRIDGCFLSAVSEVIGTESEIIKKLSVVVRYAHILEKKCESLNLAVSFRVVLRRLDLESSTSEFRNFPKIFVSDETKNSLDNWKKYKIYFEVGIVDGIENLPIRPWVDIQKQIRDSITPNETLLINMREYSASEGPISIGFSSNFDNSLFTYSGSYSDSLIKIKEDILRTKGEEVIKELKSKLDSYTIKTAPLFFLKELTSILKTVSRICDYEFTDFFIFN